MNIGMRCLQAALVGSVLQLPLHATAGDQVAVVSRIAINKTKGAMAFIRLSIAPNSPAACSTDPYWHFTVPLVTDLDRELYNLLVKSFSSGRQVYIYGDNACNDIGTVESAYAVSAL